MTLSDEQYQGLLKEENSFHTLVNQGWCKNLPYPFLQTLNQIHMDVFSGPPVNLRCPSCISTAMHQLWPLMESKKAEYVKREEDRIIAETIKKRDQASKQNKK